MTKVDPEPAKKKRRVRPFRFKPMTAAALIASLGATKAELRVAEDVLALPGPKPPVGKRRKRKGAP